MEFNSKIRDRRGSDNYDIYIDSLKTIAEPKDLYFEIIGDGDDVTYKVLFIAKAQVGGTGNNDEHIFVFYIDKDGELNYLSDIFCFFKK